MFALTRFAILAAFCSLVAVTLSPMPTIAVAVEPVERGIVEGGLAVSVNGKPILKVPVLPTSSNPPTVEDEIQRTSDTRRDGDFGVPVTVDITATSNPTGSDQIASFVLDRSDGSSPDGGNSNGAAFVLDTSGTNETDMYLAGPSIPSSRETAASDASSDIPASLQVPVYEPGSVELACFDSDYNQPHTEPMTTTPCDSDTTEANSHRSQVFVYEGQTGAIRPMWFDGTTDEASLSTSLVDANSGDTTASSNGAMSSDSITLSNSTTSSVTAGSNPGSVGKRDDVSTGSHNVTLAVPGDATVDDGQVPASSLDVTVATTTTVTAKSIAFDSASTQSVSLADMTGAADDLAVSPTLSSGSSTSIATSVRLTIDSASPPSVAAGAPKVNV